MPLTSAEKQRAYRERKKQDKLERLKTASGDSANVFKKPFSEWVQDNPNFTNVELALGLIGIEAPNFEDERGASAFAFPEALGTEGDAFSEAENALGRAEVIVGCLLTAAIEMAGIINTYKKEEIENRQKHLENPETTDRKSAIEEAIKLNKMLEHFNKPVRWPMPQWKDGT